MIEKVAPKSEAAASSIPRAASPDPALGDWLDFWASVVGSLAWPILILILVFTFRDPLRRLLSQMRLFKGLGFEAEFREGVDQFKRQVEAAASERARAQPKPDSQASEGKYAAYVGSDLARLLVSPEATVLMAWREVEKAIRERASSAGIATPKGRGPLALAEALAAAGRLLPETLASIKEASRLRNAAAHGGKDIRFAEAAAYRDVTEALVSTIRLEDLL